MSWRRLFQVPPSRRPVRGHGQEGREGEEVPGGVGGQEEIVDRASEQEQEGETMTRPLKYVTVFILLIDCESTKVFSTHMTLMPVLTKGTLVFLCR